MDGYITIKTELDTKSFDRQISELENELETLEKRYEETKNMKPFKGQQEDLQKIGLEIEKVNNKLVTMKRRQADISKADLPNIKEGLGDIGKSMEDIGKKVVKWGLAIFGVRSAYMGIRRAMSVLLEQDKQMSADVDYIKNVIAYTLEPVIRKIIDLAKTLLTYIGYIIKAWTGKDIFEKANKQLGKANKSAKQLGKTLSGFDETNIMGQQSSGGSGITTPSIKPLEDSNVPAWLKWIAENKDVVIGALVGIAGGLVSVKLGLTGIQGLGVGLALFGIITALEGIIKFLKDPTFENFIKTCEGIATAVTGIGLAIGVLPLAVGGALALVVVLMLKYYNEIIGFFDKIELWLENTFYPALKKLFGDKIATAIISPIRFVVALGKTLFSDFYGGIKTWIGGIIKIFKGDFKGGIADVFKGLKSIMLAPLNALISGINAITKGLNKISFDIPDWVPIIGGKKFGFNIPQIPKLAKGGIISLPGQGVPLGSALGGEKRPEGVLPLSDEQVMNRLGEAIAKHMSISPVIPVYIGNRLVAKEMRTINAESNFAYNR